MSVGSFPGLISPNRRTIRAPVNPLDKSTVISVFPRPIDEVKHTIQPGRFKLDAGSIDKPSILIVITSSWWREIDEEQPLLEIPTSSIQVADSIVRDYCNGLLACNMGNIMPGLFFVPGEFTVELIKKQFPHKLKEANENQRRWYGELIKLADALWARSNGNPLTIGDDMRMAAQELGITTKDWLKDFKMMDTVKCIACGALRNPEFPVCGSCHAIIDKEKAKELGLTFAQ